MDIIHALGYTAIFSGVFLMVYKTIMDASVDDVSQPPRNQYPFDPDEF